MEDLAAGELSTVTGGNLFLGLLLAKTLRDREKAAVAHLIAPALSGIANPALRAMASTQIATRLVTGAPATARQLEQSAIKGAVRAAGGGG